jgi:hypothetical protein
MSCAKTTMILFTLLLPLVLSGMTTAWTTPVTCLSWDGIVADTTNWRMVQGIKAALHVWPFLDDKSGGIGDSTWLRNKMRAVAPHLGGLEQHLSVEYALLARLLLEEQQLDPSVGKSGKYASKFHPQGPKSIAIPSARSSRPLTVGEIQANWRENLLDTLLVRYAVDKKNPVPILQLCIDQLEILPSRNSLVCEAIEDSACHFPLAIAVPRESELPMATNMLPSLHAATAENLHSSSCFMVGSERSILQDLCKEHSEVRFVGSNWATLQKVKQLVDLYPHLSISLAAWTTSVAQQNQAAMDPIIRVVTEDEFLESLSARIVNTL